MSKRRKKRPKLTKTKIIFLGLRSINTPANKVINKNGRKLAAFIYPICTGEAWRKTTAVKGKASKVISEPKREIVSPNQSLKKRILPKSS
jgi:hypothetical protein